MIVNAAAAAADDDDDDDESSIVVAVQSVMMIKRIESYSSFIINTCTCKQTILIPYTNQRIMHNNKTPAAEATTIHGCPGVSLFSFPSPIEDPQPLYPVA